VATILHFSAICTLAAPYSANADRLTIAGARDSVVPVFSVRVRPPVLTSLTFTRPPPFWASFFFSFDHFFCVLRKLLALADSSFLPFPDSYFVFAVIPGTWL